MQNADYFLLCQIYFFLTNDRLIEVRAAGILNMRVWRRILQSPKANGGLG